MTTTTPEQDMKGGGEFQTNITILWDKILAPSQS